MPPPLTNWMIDSPKSTPSILISPLRSTSSSVPTVRPIPVFAASTLNPGPLNNHVNNPAGHLVHLASNHPPIRPIPTSQLTTNLQQQLLPNSYLHGIYTQQGIVPILFYENMHRTLILLSNVYVPLYTLIVECFSIARNET